MRAALPLLALGLGLAAGNVAVANLVGRIARRSGVSGVR